MSSTIASSRCLPARLRGRAVMPATTAASQRRALDRPHQHPSDGPPWALRQTGHSLQDAVYQRFGRWAKKAAGRRSLRLFEKRTSTGSRWAAGRCSTSRPAGSTSAPRAGDCPQAEPLLERVVTVPDPETSDLESPGSEMLDSEMLGSRQPPALGAVLADKGYDSNDLLKCVVPIQGIGIRPGCAGPRCAKTRVRLLRASCFRCAVSRAAP